MSTQEALDRFRRGKQESLLADNYYGLLQSISEFGNTVAPIQLVERIFTDANKKGLSSEAIFSHIVRRAGHTDITADEIEMGVLAFRKSGSHVEDESVRIGWQTIIDGNIEEFDMNGDNVQTVFDIFNDTQTEFMESQQRISQ